MTPEGKIKARVKELLTTAQSNSIPLYFFFPPANGYGRAGVPDIVGSVGGRFFAIETKVPGRKPTELQNREADRIGLSGGQYFLCYGTEEDLLRIEEFIYRGSI